MSQSWFVLFLLPLSVHDCSDVLSHEPDMEEPTPELPYNFMKGLRGASALCFKYAA